MMSSLVVVVGCPMHSPVDNDDLSGADLWFCSPSAWPAGVSCCTGMMRAGGEENISHAGMTINSLSHVPSL